MKDMELISVHITKWKKPIWKGYVFGWLWHSGKGKAMETVKDYWGSGGRDEQAEHRGVLGQWKYSAWNCNDGYMSYIYPNP